MRKVKIVIGAMAAIFLAAAGTVYGSMLIPASEKAKERSGAPENSPVINENWELERVDFIHYAKPDHPGQAAKGSKALSCYKTLGPKWKELPIEYVVNPAGSGLAGSFLADAISTAAEEWDGWTGSELFANSYAVTSDFSYGTQDFVNALSFGDYPDDRVIAVTTIWYTPKGRQLVEFDVLFDTDYAWGDATLDPTVMDLANIATHEIGHGVGLADIYETACSKVTMYGYSGEGEIDKRTLEQPDINGIQKLYGGL